MFSETAPSQREFLGKNGKKVIVDIPAKRQDGSTGFVIGGHKTGSVLITKIIKELSDIKNASSIPVESSVWSQGLSIPDWPEELYDFMDQGGYLFYSFRWLQKLPSLKIFEESPKLFFIRDLRDVAVSYFYSMAKSHGVPKSGSSKEAILRAREEAAGLNIDEFIESGKCNPILNNIVKFLEYSNDSNSTIIKYEDFIYDKVKVVRLLVDFIGIAVEDEVVREIASKNDVIPDSENVDSHIRNVHPGNYKEKLSQSSIEYIENRYSKFLTAFGYKTQEQV